MAAMPAADATHKAARLPTAAQASKDMDNIVRKVGELEHMQTHLAKRKDDALQTLIKAQELFEEKDSELQACQAKYDRVLKNLQEKQAARQELREKCDDCNRQMKDLVSTVTTSSRKAAYLCQELSGNYHSTERAAERGFSCRKEPVTPRDVTQKARPAGFGSTGASILNTPRTLGLGASSTPAPSPR